MLDVAITLGMSPVGDAAAWHYPTDAGKGGSGMTLVQPITDSFLALDTWPDFDGAYFMIASCKKFSADQIAPIVEGYGLEFIDQSEFAILRLL